MTRLLKFCIKIFQTFQIPKSSRKLELRKIYGSWDSRKLIGICFARGNPDSVHNACSMLFQIMEREAIKGAKSGLIPADGWKEFQEEVWDFMNNP